MGVRLFPFYRGLTHLTHPFSIRGDATGVCARETLAIVYKAREEKAEVPQLSLPGYTLGS